jgi:hypothetical protein
MKFGAKPPVIWHEAKELNKKFSKLNSRINKLLLLESLWEKQTGAKARFWRLDAVKEGTIYIKVNVMAARHELKLKEKDLIKELNKSFDKPWIEKISIL